MLKHRQQVVVVLHTCVAYGQRWQHVVGGSLIEDGVGLMDEGGVRHFMQISTTGVSNQGGCLVEDGVGLMDEGVGQFMHISTA